MANKDKERRRDDGLAAVIPILTADLERLNLKFAGLRSGLPGRGILHDPMLAGLPGLLFASMPTYEGEANEFGELKAEAEDMVDDLRDDLADLDTLVNAATDGNTGNDKSSRAAARAKAQQVATAIQAALDKAREARRKAKGAATAAKKLAAANPKLLLARNSFREASEKLHKYDLDKAAADSKALLQALARLLKDARDKIDQDLAHLNAAMELVV